MIKTVRNESPMSIQLEASRSFYRNSIATRTIQKIASKKLKLIGSFLAKSKDSLFGIIAPMYFEGNTDTEIFNQWIEEFLIPELKPSQIVIMDNAAFHKSQRTTYLVESANCGLLYLPPYSPDFNPIEQKWGHVKNKVRKIRDKFEKFDECLERVLCYQ